jgi:hypothetical protein
MKSAQSALCSMDAYIAAFPHDVQAMLEQIRTISDSAEKYPMRNASR